MNATPERTIVVTGASSGIGRAFTLLVARQRARIFAVGRRAEALASLAEQVTHEGGTIATLVTDVSEPYSGGAIVTRALARFGRIDVVFACAGEVAAGPLLAQTDAQLVRQFGTHVIGPLALVRDAFGALRESKGHVIVVGSGVARVPVDGLGAYPASKAALRSAAATLRRELRAYGIALTYVDPGAVDTGFMQRAGMASAPAWLMTTPEHVARAVLRSLSTRPRELNAVPYQTAFVALAERFPRLTDLLLTRIPALVGGEPTSVGGAAGRDVVPPDELSATPPPPSTVAPPEAPSPSTVGTTPEAPPPSTLEEALAPVARRMERLNLSRDFVKSLLVANATLTLSDVAMQWAGMPNKNERALTREVLEALASAGYLAAEGEDQWIVRRGADS